MYSSFCPFVPHVQLLKLGDLAHVIRTKGNAIWTNQISALLLNRWSKITVKTISTVKNFIRYSWLTVLFFLYSFSLKNNTQFPKSSNYSLFTGENAATICSVVTVLASFGLTKKRFSHHARYLEDVSFRTPTVRDQLHNMSQSVLDKVHISNSALFIPITARLWPRLENW